MNHKDIDKIISILKKEVQHFFTPIVTEYANETADPFKVLISCLLSLRTKDEVTAVASRRLFKLADNPEDMAKLTEPQIQKVIYPVGFYVTKAKRIKEICQTLIAEYDSRVPDDLDELLKLRGVGRKTANLVITLGYGKDGICVDTHVHRISNRLGFIQTKTPEQSEFALRKELPKKHWLVYNDLLVSYGQNVCKPVSPLCSQCKIAEYCDRVGVTRSR
ncbi:MAG: endonuclease III domain-containing protein [bacterium]